MPDTAFWAATGLGVAWFLVAAKVHGRHIRLERELQGFTDVSFGRDAANPAWVEALWRADRIRFWTRLPILAAMVFLAVWAASARGLARPFNDLPGLGAAFLAAALWAPALAFLANGLGSLLRFGRARNDPGASGPVADRRGWLAREDRATAGYWAVGFTLGVLAVVVAFV